MKKKILFLSFNYPYGNVGASTICSSRIIKELCNQKEYEVHCISYDGDVQRYEYDDRVIIHRIPKIKIHKPTLINFLLYFAIYPLYQLVCDYWHYLQCRKICKQQQFDLVVAQYFPEQCLMSGVLLKRNGYIKNLMVIFWDNIYGKTPRKFIPQKVALRKQRKVESYIAKYADTLVSLYPIKDFHEKYGDIPEAIGRRLYLGIPSVLPPKPSIPTAHLQTINKDKINILYSGSIIRPEVLRYCVNLLNKSLYAEQINLIFFSKGLSDSEFEELKCGFKGSINNVGYIPLPELYSVYKETDFFLSLPGNPRSICSKGFEYMSYGHPMILFFEDMNDVNVKTFSKYPLNISIYTKELVEKDNINKIDQFIQKSKGKKVPFKDVEEMYILDSPRAYVDLISKHC